MRSKLLVILGIVAGVIGIGWLIGHFAGGSVGNLPPVAQNPAPTATQPATAPADTQPTASTPIQPILTNPIATAPPLIQTSSVAGATTNPPDLSTNWEDTIDNIIGSDDPDTNKVKQLFALFPKLPPDGQEEAAQHLSNLVEDENYGPLGDLLKNDKLPEGVLDELLADVLNRPNSLKLPVLLDVASDPNNAKHDEAKDLIELYLGEDYGNDWNSWGQHMTNWLQQNPD